MSDSNPISQEEDLTVGTPTPTPDELTGQQTAKPIDPNSLFADQLAQIRTEDGRQKYADVATALASVPHAQSYIKNQAEELAALKAELAKMKGMEEMLQQLKSQQTVETPSTAPVDETKIAQILDQKLKQKEQETLAQNNASKVLGFLSEKFGDKAEEMFNKQAESLGVSVGFLSDLARKAPNAVLAYFGNTTKQSPNISTGSINTAVLDTTPPKKDESYMRVFRSGTSDLVNKWREAGNN